MDPLKEIANCGGRRLEKDGPGTQIIELRTLSTHGLTNQVEDFCLEGLCSPSSVRGERNPFPVESSPHRRRYYGPNARPKTARRVPVYQMGIGDVDAFFARAIKL